MNYPFQAGLSMVILTGKTFKLKHSPMNFDGYPRGAKNYDNDFLIFLKKCDLKELLNSPFELVQVPWISVHADVTNY